MFPDNCVNYVPGCSTGLTLRLERRGLEGRPYGLGDGPRVARPAMLCLAGARAGPSAGERGGGHGVARAEGGGAERGGPCHRSGAPAAIRWREEAWYLSSCC